MTIGTFREADNLTPEEQIQHWMDTEGHCRRSAVNCVADRCIYKAAGNPCKIADIYKFAKRNNNVGVCDSIWKGE